MKQPIFLLSVCFCIAFLSGCVSVGPDYEAPETQVPDAWHESVQEDFNSGESNLTNWWAVFNDDTLNALITKAATNNLNLKVASARIEQAAALRGVSVSGYFPSISADGGVSAVNSRGSSQVTDVYNAGLTMAWELDLWGRVRRSVESADASLQATVEDYRDVMVLLYADIAASYINVRTVQERIALAENNLEAQTETLELTQNRFDSGLVPALDVSQAELNTSRTASLIPPLYQSQTEAINRLSVLTGDMPYALQQELAQAKPIPEISGDITLGLPAELLRQRPDIRRAERELAAQNAKIGATKAELFPTLTLPGSLTLESSSGSDLFTSGSTAYSFGPQLKWEIFNAGRIRNNVRAEEAGTKAALHTYEQTVLLALEEVENSMSAYANERDRIESLTAAAESAQKSVDLVSQLYKSGLTDFQNVLNMEQALLEQQDDLASSQGAISLNVVNVYKALGGGWDGSAEE